MIVSHHVAARSQTWVICKVISLFIMELSLQLLHLPFLKQGLWVNSEVTILVRLSDHWVYGSACLCLPPSSKVTGAWDLNLGPHVCMVGTLQTELSPSELNVVTKKMLFENMNMCNCVWTSYSVSNDGMLPHYSVQFYAFVLVKSKFYLKEPMISRGNWGVCII